MIPLTNEARSTNLLAMNSLVYDSISSNNSYNFDGHIFTSVPVLLDRQPLDYMRTFVCLFVVNVVVILVIIVVVVGIVVFVIVVVVYHKPSLVQTKSSFFINFWKLKHSFARMVKDDHTVCIVLMMLRLQD